MYDTDMMRMIDGECQNVMARGEIEQNKRGHVLWEVVKVAGTTIQS